MHWQENYLFRTIRMQKVFGSWINNFWVLGVNGPKTGENVKKLSKNFWGSNPRKIKKPKSGWSPKKFHFQTQNSKFSQLLEAKMKNRVSYSQGIIEAQRTTWNGYLTNAESLKLKNRCTLECLIVGGEGVSKFLGISKMGVVINWNGYENPQNPYENKHFCLL